MRSSNLFKIVSGIVVAGCAFLITLFILDYWSTDDDPSANVIQIVDATYGMNCSNAAAGPGQIKLSAGNVTEAVDKICGNASGQCQFVADVMQFGDPAPGCGKDLIINWRCGSAQKLHRINIAPEAHGKTVTLRCPAR